ncbi:uncharacterized protein PAC_01081 [Phialocephala subalpina]|uniref:Uncharacterized protein n=1 Tax=Phialocephala subalpina TaxID=576137 RepID=A0A1L7WEL3_9HELO|nr:uncharacterized protein PAC_01081 [Phialocephala subalpina]
MSPTKPPTQIEVWRTEVQRSIPYPISYTPTESVYHAPPIAPPSFWKKILRRSSQPPPPNPELLLPTSPTKLEGSKRSKLKNSLKGRRKDEDVEEEQGVRTEMYDRTPSPTIRRRSSLMVPGDEHEHEDRGSSMEVGDEEEGDVDASLRERRARLERAARLLDREKERRKDDEMRKDSG